MHPWIQLFSTYISQQLPNTHNALQTALVLVQSFLDNYHMQSLDDTCEFLSKFPFKTLAELYSPECNYTINITPHKDIVDTNNSILVGRLITDAHNKTGEIILQDATGSIVTCCMKLDACDLNVDVMVIHAVHVSITNDKCLYCFKHMRKNIDKYIELHSWIKKKDNLINDVSLETDSKNPFMSISTYIKLPSKPKHVNIEGIVINKSPIHKVCGHNPFFFISLKCQHVADKILSIVIQGISHAHWYEFIHLFNCIQLTELKLTVINKGTKDERKLRCNSADSALSILSLSAEKDDIFENSMNISSEVGECSVSEGFISYVGVITETKYAEFGLYCLDEKVKLLVSHQPQVHFGRGLRIGCRIHAFNVHPINHKKKELILCCCTKSCIEFVDLSSQNTPYHPFVAQVHPFASVCQKLPLQQYLWIIDVLTKIKDILPTDVHISNEDLKQLQPILDKFITPVANRPSIFSEFFDDPHTCIFTLPMQRKLKIPCAVVSVQEFVDYYEKVAQDDQFQCNWLHGKEFDHYQGNKCKDMNWWYAIVDSTMMQQKLLLCGKICLAYGHLKLLDKSGSINIVIPRIDDVMLDKFVLLQSYKVVVEKCSYEELVKANGKTRRTLMYRIYIMGSKEDLVIFSQPVDTLNDVLPNNRRTLEKSIQDDIPNKKRKLVKNVPDKNEDVMALLIAREFKRQRVHYDVEVHSNHHIYVPGLGRVDTSDVLRKGISLYPFTTSVLILRLQNIVSKKMMSLYVDSNNLPYYFALLPGVSFKLTNVDIITSKAGPVYYKLKWNSTVEIRELPSSSFECLKALMQGVQEEIKKDAERRSLITFVRDDVRKTIICRDLFILLGRISQVQLVVAKWSCLQCFEEITDQRCTPGCKQNKTFRLELRCVIDDGTAEGYLHVEEPNSSKLLQLSEQDKDLLKSTSYRSGQINYGRSTSNKGIVADIKNSSKRQQCEYMLLTHATKTSVSKLLEFYLKPFKQKEQSSGYPTCVLVSGVTEYHSLSYRKLTFECLSFRNTNYKQLLKTYSLEKTSTT